MAAPPYTSGYRKSASLDVFDLGRAATLVQRIRSLRAQDKTEAVEVRKLLAKWFREEPTVGLVLPLTLPDAGTTVHVDLPQLEE